MTEEKFYTPLKIGLFIVVLSYFLFTLHTTFTLSWIGEWNRSGHFYFDIYITDISGLVGLIFRFAASIIAFSAIIFYFAKKNISKPTAYKLLRWILVFEGIYWLSLLTTGVTDVQSLISASSGMGINLLLRSFALGPLPSLVESIAPPIVLFIFAFKLNPGKPLKNAIKWGLITGTVYIFVFWLTNTTSWLTTIVFEKGTAYLTSYPENLLSFILTAFGLLALAIYTAYFAKKSIGTATLQELKLKTIGAIILAFGMYFLWNYLTWIFFGGNYLWSDWYAWFLGHNMDLWMLSLPLLGIPLLFADDIHEKANSQ
ncbi:MAG: hypothetical protein ABSD42_07345 [Candidatus Bathyarchaeia archaeon]|jgi:hypothetical protein